MTLRNSYFLLSESSIVLLLSLEPDILVMGKSVTKTVKVPASKAEDWDEYLKENPEVDSISHLIRLSVEKEINGSHGERDAPSGDTETRNEGEILTALRQIQTDVGDVEERLSALEGIKTAEADYDLRKAVYSFLPEERDNLEYATWATTVEEIARKLGAEESDVKDTLDSLEERTGQVASVAGGPEGETYWFKRAE